MRFINLVLFFLVFTTSYFAEAQVDKELYSNSFEDISDTINKYLYTDKDKSLSASRIFLKKAQEAKDSEKQYLGFEALSASYLYHRDFANADREYQNALNFVKSQNNDDLLTKAYIWGSQIQLSMPNASSALELLEKAMLLAEKTDNSLQKETITSMTASILQLAGNNEESIKIRKKIIQNFKTRNADSIFTEDRKKQSLFYSYLVLSSAYIAINNADSAKVYIGEMERLVKPTDSCLTKSLWTVKGELDYLTKDYVSAKKNFTNSINICNEDIPIQKLRDAYYLGKVALAQEKFQEAKSIFQAGLNNYGVTPSEEAFMDDYYKLLAESYKETGEFEKAGYYFEKYINSTSEFNKLKNEVETSAKAKEIEKFRKELEALEAEKEKKDANFNYLLLAGSLVILLLLFFLLKFYRNKKANEIKFEKLLSKIKTAEKPENIIDTKDEVLEETNSSEVSAEVTIQILEGLKKLEKQEYFLKQDCNSYNVAKKINTNTSYLSKVINSHYGKNFNTYINDLRINYAIVRLRNDVIFRSYSIQSIAEEIGYKSADSFTKYFKKDTGLNPSFYIKEIKNIT